MNNTIQKIHGQSFIFDVKISQPQTILNYLKNNKGVLW